MKINLQLFAGDFTIHVRSNDGQTLLMTQHASNSTIIEVTSSGITVGSQSYTYSGDKIFAGLTTTINSSTVDLAIGYSETTLDTITAFPSIEEYDTVTLYIVEQETTFTYKHLLKDSSKIQVDSAIRDGNGLKIDTGYQKALPTTTTVGQLLKSTSTSGTFALGNSLPYLTTAPSAANSEGLILVVLSSEPATKYSGYIYIITSS